MTDIYTPSERSNIMSKISGKETKPEILVRSFLFLKGFRFRKNDKRYPGSPDIVLPKYRTAIFVHGCFWHGHNCNAGKLPETRKEFWTKKISETKIRDEKNRGELQELDWNIIVIWQCEIKTKQAREQRLSLLIEEIKRNIH